MRERSVYSINQRRRLEAETTHEREERLQQLSDNQQRKLDTETTAHARPIMHSILLVIGASVSEPHLGSSTRPLSVCLSVCLYIYIYIYISYVRHLWSRGPRATRKRKPAHLKFKGHMHACCIILYVANASRAITTLIERLHMYSRSLITSSAG